MYLLYIYGSFVCMYVSVLHVQMTEESMGFLELELLQMVSCRIGTGNRTSVFLKNS